MLYAELFSDSRERRALYSLDRWLNFEIKSSFLTGAIFFLPYGLVFTALQALMVVFFPVLIWRLIEARWFRTLAVFAVLMAGAQFGLQALGLAPAVTGYLAPMARLIPFYLFCIILRFVVADRLHDLDGAAMLARWDSEDLLSADAVVTDHPPITSLTRAR